MFNTEIDVAAIMREIKKAAMVHEGTITDVRNSSESAIGNVKNELIRINDFIYNTHKDSENYIEMGREIPVNKARPYIIQKILILYRRFFRKSTRFLALDQKKYNEYVGAEIKALQEGQIQLIKVIDILSLLNSENENLKKQINTIQSLVDTANDHIDEYNQKTNELFEKFSQESSDNLLSQLSELKTDLQRTCAQSFLAYEQEQTANFHSLTSTFEQNLHKEWRVQFEDFANSIEQKYQKSNHLDDKTYCAFEEKFRGTSEEIKQRLQIYIDKYIIPNIRYKQTEKILDLGCGRGEFLELLAENGFNAEGIDSNQTMVETCTQKGLSAFNEDLFEYLSSLPDNSIKIITAFQVIEHIGHDKLVALLKEAYRVLDYHGCLILETPNCLNAEVGSGSFYSDPTHIRPIYPAYAEFLAQNCGYYETELFYWKDEEIKKWISSVTNADSTDILNSPVVRTLLESVKKAFYVSPDYAIIATK